METWTNEDIFTLCCLHSISQINVECGKEALTCVHKSYKTKYDFTNIRHLLTGWTDYEYFYAYMNLVEFNDVYLAHLQFLSFLIS